MEASAIELFTAGIATFTALGVLLLAIDMRRLNRKFDQLKGRVDSVETAQNAHVNAAGLHAR